MNTAQRVAIWIGIVALLLTVVFPPWSITIVGYGRQLTRHRGHGFLFASRDDRYGIDMSRILVEWVLVGGVTGAAIILFLTCFGTSGATGSKV